MWPVVMPMMITRPRSGLHPLCPVICSTWTETNRTRWRGIATRRRITARFIMTLPIITWNGKYGICLCHTFTRSRIGWSWKNVFPISTVIWIIIVLRGFLTALPKTRYTNGIIKSQRPRRFMLTWIRFNGEMLPVRTRWILTRTIKTWITRSSWPGSSRQVPCCITTRWDGRTIVLISPSITVMEMTICGGPVWMHFCLCGIRISCRGGGTRKFQPFPCARRERMEFICMTWSNLMISGKWWHPGVWICIAGKHQVPRLMTGNRNMKRRTGKNGKRWRPRHSRIEWVSCIFPCLNCHSTVLFLLISIL